MRLTDNFANYSFFASDIFTFACDFPGKEEETRAPRGHLSSYYLRVYVPGAFSFLMKIYYVISSPALLFDVAG